METSDAAKATSNEPPSGSPNVGESVGQSSSTKSTGSVSEESLSLRNLELPSLNSDAGQLEGRYSFETHFEFSSKELTFEKQCEEIIKEITRKDINDDNRPSFEQRVKGKSQLEKIEICQGYDTIVKFTHQNAKDCVCNDLKKHNRR